MKHLELQQTQSFAEHTTLTPYHQERNRVASLAVEEMLKHPYSLKQAKEQVRLNKEMLRDRENF